MKNKTNHIGDVNEMINNKKMTALEWLISKLQKTRDWQRVINEANESSTSVRDVIAEAKEMEKGQIVNSYTYNSVIRTNSKAEQYYNETYGGNK